SCKTTGQRPSVSSPEWRKPSVALPDTPVIKICGLRDATATIAAVDAGATALGFILAPSRRRVQASEVRAILNDLPEDHPVTVGVVVNESAIAIAALLAESGVDLIQLSGDETPDMLGDLDTTIWKSL